MAKMLYQVWALVEIWIPCECTNRRGKGRAGVYRGEIKVTRVAQNLYCKVSNSKIKTWPPSTQSHLSSNNFLTEYLSDRATINSAKESNWENWVQKRTCPENKNLRRYTWFDSPSYFTLRELTCFLVHNSAWVILIHNRFLVLFCWKIGHEFLATNGSLHKSSLDFGFTAI